MGDPNELPIETAKATQEVAKLGTTAVEAVSGATAKIASIFGTVPEDLVGRFGGDWLKVSRMENAASLVDAAKRRLAARGITKFEPLSPSLGVPLLTAAADETKPELRSLWESLLARAMDPERSGEVRKAFIEIVQRMDPLDALVLKRADWSTTYTPSLEDALASFLNKPRDSVAVSLWHLKELGLLRQKSIGEFGAENHDLGISVIGREFLWAVTD